MKDLIESLVDLLFDLLKILKKLIDAEVLDKEKITSKNMTTGQALEMISRILKEGGQSKNIEIFGEDKVYKKSDTAGINDLEEVLKRVRGIVKRQIPSDRVFLRSGKTYSGILLDDNDTKPMCRIYPQGKRTPRRIAIPEIVDGKIERVNGQKAFKKYDIVDIGDLSKCSDAILKTVLYYLNRDKMNSKNTATKQLLKIVREILKKQIPPDKIFFREGRTYGSIILGGNHRKLICRLYPKGKRTPSRVEILEIVDGKRTFKKHDIVGMDDLSKYSDAILEVALSHKNKR